MSSTFTMEDLRKKLQERQNKMTPQRREVLQIFLDHPGEHLSAEDVHDILRQSKSDIGLATVYRTLDLLSDLDILLEELEQKIESQLCFHVLNHEVKFIGYCKECREKS